MADLSLAELKAELARRKQEQSTGESPLSAGVIAAGKGLTDIGRVAQTGFNLLTGNDEAQAALDARKAEEAALFAPLAEEFPISTTVGEIVGETAAALPFGLGAGAAVVKGAGKASPLVQRLLSSGVGGIVEGGIVGAAEDQLAGGAIIGGGAALTAEILFPKISGVLKRVFRNPNIQIENIVQIADGTIKSTPQLDEALSQVGLKFDDITNQAV